MFIKFSQFCQNLFHNGPLHFSILSLLIICIITLVDLRAHGSSLTIFLVTGAISSSTLCNLCIPWLSKCRMKQTIRQAGPLSHYSKLNTPTMGGVFATIAGLTIILLAKGIYINNNPFFSVLGLNIVYLSIGCLDDWRSLNQSTGIGLSPRGKLVLQSLGAIVFMLVIYQDILINTEIGLPFLYTLKIGVLIWPLILFVLLAESNSANLTDGLDGLLAGCGVIVLIGLTLHLMLRGGLENIKMASLCASIAGSWLGFLSVNRNPARIFMGDAGSLSLGVSIAIIALLNNILWPLFLMGGTFLIESVSVIIQVSLFKLTKGKDNQSKRLFRMTPLHHHFELGGVNEAKIVSLFWITSFLLAIISLSPDL